jgi:hypothetical protein
VIQRRRMQGAYATWVNGWIRAHFEGTPGEIGYQNGVLLAREIRSVMDAVRLYVKHTWADWAFFRKAAEELYMPKIPADLEEELRGILEGMRDVGVDGFDYTDVVALNGYFDTSYSYYYYLKAQALRAKGERVPPMEEHGGCSAFVATGSVTRDGRVVMAHNTWFPYMVSRWNVIADVAPDKGHRFLMQCFPGTVYSGTDFYLNDAGLAVTETTITGMFTFRPEGTPYFVRARRAIQYAGSLDEWSAIMLKDNNGGYANDWLAADTRTGEIMTLELGTYHHRIWRTTDGFFVGCNVAQDPDVRSETSFDYDDPNNACNARHRRWHELFRTEAGRVDVEFAKRALADHYDVRYGREEPSRSTLCGHVDLDPTGLPEWEWGGYYPGGSFDGIVTNAELARTGSLWAHWGKPCGTDYRFEEHLKAHPEYAWQRPQAQDVVAYPWTLFSAGW